MTKENYDKVKALVTKQGVPFNWFVYNSWCTLNIDKASITVEMLDDLYTGLVSGVMYNLGRDKTPMRMEGIGPNPEDRFSKESYNKVFDELGHFVSMTNPVEEWEIQHPESEWPDIIEKHMSWEQIHPEHKMLQLRQILIKKQTKRHGN